MTKRPVRKSSRDYYDLLIKIISNGFQKEKDQPRKVMMQLHAAKFANEMYETWGPDWYRENHPFSYFPATYTENEGATRYPSGAIVIKKEPQA